MLLPIHSISNQVILKYLVNIYYVQSTGLGKAEAKAVWDGKTYTCVKYTITRSVVIQCELQAVQQDNTVQWPKEWHRSAESKFTVASKTKLGEK